MIKIYNAPKGAKKPIRKAYKTALKHFTQRDIFSCELAFLSEEEMRALNLRARGVDAATDVLSFPALSLDAHLPVSNPPEGCEFDGRKVILGEIAICVEIMKRQAAEYGHGEERECAFLALHGLLHLLGFDHEREEDRAKMRAAEEGILNKAGILR